MGILERTHTSTFKTAGQVAPGDVIIGNNPNADIRVDTVEPGQPHYLFGDPTVHINGRMYFARSGLFIK